MGRGRVCCGNGVCVGGTMGERGVSLPVKCFFEGADFVLAGNKKVEQGDDGTFELSATTSVDCCWA